jgi:hypothetical protein
MNIGSGDPPNQLPPRQRDEQELRNGVELMGWIEHLTAHPAVPIDLNLVCFFNERVLHGT